MVKIDPTEKRDQHCKLYLEPSVKKEIEKYQFAHGLLSFSEAGRRLILSGLSSEEQGRSAKAVNPGSAKT